METKEKNCHPDCLLRFGVITNAIERRRIHGVEGLASATAPLVIGKPRPWHLPPAYVRGVVILHLCLQRAMDAPMPAEVFDHIVSFLPRDPTCFIDEATLRANLPWPREHNLFAIIARPRHRNGELVTCV